jgi:hypothetical protein
MGDVNGDGVDDFHVEGTDSSMDLSYLGIFYGGSDWAPR